MGRMKDVFTEKMLADEATANACGFGYFWEGEPTPFDAGFAIPQPSQLTAEDRAVIDAIDWFPVATATDAVAAPMTVEVETAVIDTTMNADVIRFSEGGFDVARSIRRSADGTEVVIELRYGIRDGDEFFFAKLYPLGFADDHQTESTTVCMMPTLSESFDRAIAEYDGTRECRAYVA